MVGGAGRGGVEARLFRDKGRNEPPARVPVDFAWVHRELTRVGVTLQTLWVEYREGRVDPVRIRGRGLQGRRRRALPPHREHRDVGAR